MEAASKLCPTINSFMTAKQIEEQRERQIGRNSLIANFYHSLFCSVANACVGAFYLSFHRNRPLLPCDAVHISTGSQALDDILEGGIETKSITEMYGEYRCGKTQLCHTLAVTSQINAQNPGKVAWIDTEGAFRPKRIRAIAARFGVDPDSVLDNVNVVRVATWEHQMAVLEPLAAMMADQPYKLVIMDSISACFRTDFSGRGELADRQQKLGQMLAKLRKLAEEYNIAIFVTNQVMSDPSGGALFVSDPKKAVGGHVRAGSSSLFFIPCCIYAVHVFYFALYFCSLS